MVFSLNIWDRTIWCMTLPRWFGGKNWDLRVHSSFQLSYCHLTCLFICGALTVIMRQSCKLRMTFLGLSDKSLTSTEHIFCNLNYSFYECFLDHSSPWIYWRSLLSHIGNDYEYGREEHRMRRLDVLSEKKGTGSLIYMVEDWGLLVNVMNGKEYDRIEKQKPHLGWLMKT